MIDSFSDELQKIAAELPYKGEQRIGYALRKHKPERAKPSPGEPVHYKIGPEVHYGESRFGPHYGYKHKGEKVHIFPDRTYVGATSKSGTTERLNVSQREKARKVIKHMKNAKESSLNNMSDSTGWLSGQAGKGARRGGPKVGKFEPKQMGGSSEQIFSRIKKVLPPPKMTSKAPVHKVPAVAKAILKAVA